MAGPARQIRAITLTAATVGHLEPSANRAAVDRVSDATNHDFPRVSSTKLPQVSGRRTSQIILGNLEPALGLEPRTC